MSTRLITLTGGGPWGFTLSGGKDFGAYLRISKLTAGGKAARGGVKEGEFLLAINGEATEGLLHFDAQQMIKATGTSLQLKISSDAPKSPAIPQKFSHQHTTSTDGAKQPSSVTYTSASYSTAAAAHPKQSPSLSPEKQPSDVVPGSGLETGSSSLQQSPAFKRIYVDGKPAPSVLSPGSHPSPPTEKMQRITIDEQNVRKSSYKPPPPPTVKAATITIAKPSPPPTIVKPPPPPTASQGKSPTSPSAPTHPPSQEKMVDRQGVCAACNQPIRGPFASALGRTWHPEHFTCTACHRQLQNTMFVFEEEKIYCEDCYQQVFAKKCHFCRKPIVGPSVNALGLNWHSEHFRCSNCNFDLTQGEGFNMEANKLFCGDCYGAAFGATCFGCGQKIAGDELWVEALGHEWHSPCFKCEVCKRLLEGKTFMAKLGRPYCRECA